MQLMETFAIREGRALHFYLLRVLQSRNGCTDKLLLTAQRPH